MQQLNQNHRLLSTHCEDLIERCLSDPEQVTLIDPNSLPGLTAKYSYNAWPYLADAAFREQVVTATETVWRLLRLIPERLFGADMAALAEMFDLPDAATAAAFCRQPNGVDAALARPDFLLTADGFKCLETNVSPVLGGTQSNIWSAKYLEQPFIEQFFTENRLTPIGEDPIAANLDHFYRVAEPLMDDSQLTLITLAQEMKRPFRRSPPEFDQYFVDHFQNQGLDLDPVSFLVRRDLEGLHFEDQKVYIDGRRVHIVIGENIDLRQLLEVAHQGNLALVNAPAALMLSNKKTLALLSTHADSEVFSTEEQALIQRYIPWSRLLVPGPVRFRGQTAELADLLAGEKDAFVLKRGVGRSGNHVHLGVNQSPAEWDQIVADAFAEGAWMVQESLESLDMLGMGPDREICPHQMVWGFFCFGGKYAGSVLRVQKKTRQREKINASSGAHAAILQFI